MKRQPRLHTTLVTIRTIEQGVGKEQGKSSRNYLDSVAVCYVDPEDLKMLGMKEGNNLRISTPRGSVIVRALESERGPHPKVVFVPYGPWANAIIDPETDSIGMPSLKGIPAEIEPAARMQVLKLKRLLRKEFRKELYENR